ncbi:MAG TPA: hypothetical protein VEI97_08185 [bacterium]|nr:hypothetical protein [bacterium]
MLENHVGDHIWPCSFLSVQQGEGGNVSVDTGAFLVEARSYYEAKGKALDVAREACKRVGVKLTHVIVNSHPGDKAVVEPGEFGHTVGEDGDGLMMG